MRVDKKHKPPTDNIQAVFWQYYVSRSGGQFTRVLILKRKKMSKKVSFFIESLYEGYTLTEKGKTKALECSKNVEEYILARIKKEIERFSHTGINNILIEVEVQENCPTIEKS